MVSNINDIIIYGDDAYTHNKTKGVEVEMAFARKLIHFVGRHKWEMEWSLIVHANGHYWRTS